MHRRHALSLLFGAVGRVGAAPANSLDRFVGSAESVTALLVDIRAGRLIALSGAAAAGRALARPGSSMKPFVLGALLRSGKLRAGDSFLCPGRLAIGGHQLNCSHPPLDTPMRVDTALAYSCNCFVAHAAERLAPGELAGEFARAGLASRTGWLGADEVSGRIPRASSADARRLQALGAEGVLITAAGLASAYCRLARACGSPEMQPVLAGLEGAVEYGTAQHARVSGAQVAGKTGSVAGGVAWFAGFMPSRLPEVVVTVMMPGYSGGADAAPIAGRIFEAYRAGRV